MPTKSVPKKVKTSSEPKAKTKLRTPTPYDEEMNEYLEKQRLLGHCIEAASKATSALDANGLNSVHIDYVRKLKLEGILDRFNKIAAEAYAFEQELDTMKDKMEPPTRS